MLKDAAKITNMTLFDNYLRENRLFIEQPVISKIENNRTPKNAVKHKKNILNNRLFFLKINRYTINPVNKKQLTITKQFESIYNDYKTPKEYIIENFTNDYNYNYLIIIILILYILTQWNQLFQ